MTLDPNANYWIARGQEVFGPYTGKLVRDYLASGNIVPTDMIRGEHDSEWSGVAALFGLPQAGFVPAAPAAAAVDPGRSWAIWGIGTSAFGLLCCSCASPVGIILGVVALVVGRQESRSLAWTGIIIGIVGLILNVAIGIVMMLYPELNPFDQFMKQMPQP